MDKQIKSYTLTEKELTFELSDESKLILPRDMAEEICAAIEEEDALSTIHSEIDIDYNEEEQKALASIFVDKARSVVNDLRFHLLYEAEYDLEVLQDE